MPRAIGIIGYGSFGAFLETLIKRFAPKVKIKIHSSRFAPDGSKFFSLGEAAACDAVILAVPIAAYEKTLAKIAPLLGAKTAVVDVATVKMHTVALLKKYLPGRQWLATHPMFGPESYAKKGGSVKGLRVVIAESTLAAQKHRALRTFLKKCGFDVVEMRAQTHDKHLAETLFLTHFVGQTVHRAKFDRTPVDTVSFGYLMDAVESVKHDTQLFADVFRFNPYCEETLRRFESAERQVHALLKKSVHN